MFVLGADAGPREPTNIPAAQEAGQRPVQRLSGGLGAAVQLRHLLGHAVLGVREEQGVAGPGANSQRPHDTVVSHVIQNFQGELFTVFLASEKRDFYGRVMI